MLTFQARGESMPCEDDCFVLEKSVCILYFIDQLLILCITPSNFSTVSRSAQWTDITFEY